jgi:hypothetical protein
MAMVLGSDKMPFSGYHVAHAANPTAKSYLDQQITSIANGVKTADKAKAIAEAHYAKA